MSTADKAAKLVGRPGNRAGQTKPEQPFTTMFPPAGGVEERTKQLNVSVPASLHATLSRAALDASEASGRRVTIRDLVVEALTRAYSA